MKYFTAILLIVTTSFLGHSQTYEVGVILGGANLIGDVGSTTYLSPNTFAYGVIGKWNRSSRHAFRFSIMSAELNGDDSDSHESRRQERGYTFNNSITELSAGLEFTFWEFNMYSGRRVSTPYLFTGLNYFFYKASYIRPSEKKFIDYEGARSLSIPMAIGYKVMFATNFVLAIEIGARYSFTDDLDGSDPIGNLEDQEELKFGNLNNNDWYIFTAININFTFGRKPCYCNF